MAAGSNPAGGATPFEYRPTPLITHTPGMSEREIRYCTTTDGVRIAFNDTGAGRPIVTCPGLWSHVARTMELSAVREVIEEAVAAGARMITLDGRGMGSSDRTATDISPESQLRDLAAVVDHLGLERYVLAGGGTTSCIAITHAAARGGRVSHLILSDPVSNGEDAYQAMPMLHGLETLRETGDAHWEAYTLTAAALSTRFEDSNIVRKQAEIIRDSATPATLRAYISSFRKMDVRHLLSQVSMPTLVLRDPESQIPAEMVRAIAAAIPDARLIEVAGSRGLIAAGAGLRAIASFLGVRPAQIAPPTETAPARGPADSAIILFADIADSTAITERIGDAAFRVKARELDALLRRVIGDAGGTTIDAKTLGDGVLATFRGASQAIGAALHCSAAGADSGWPLHLGLHAGDVIREQNNVFGGAVNIAARISALSAPGEVLVSDIVRGLARTSAGVVFEDLGEHALKGVGEPVHVFAVRSRV